ncbi:hypothetical protein PTSG_09761 [Salpingoeca rosetta]|uniref:Transmembrane protein 231 n=1 Tax=Salpingoeca rosetta (strain ATCC 50818 / BSB-021) TaxID=946362 RepID=F2UNZ2_SALR5|nr:uncharacterized protein PTSG_09761 [Salpingoeca rosetta]EGD79347.1 hypothetical protein PTSG_09761 [Salpingoeca rosetta]|eukprot:XP_004989116.1 hypothetical protein PTSG_09761 [Salpingoeca rosetta]
MVCVLAEPLERRWHAGPCSGAGLCAFLGLVIIVVAPLLVCIRTGGFLLEEATYREDPLVFFQNEIVVTALDSAGLPIMTWTSIPEINAMLGDALRFPVVTARERDANFDGRPEDLEIDISLPLLGTEHVASVNLMLGFSYELQDAADMTMQSLAYISEA